jgi:CDP-2,3-bis-(O-geranylgeranyl)-sn-glycerol synthase
MHAATILQSLALVAIANSTPLFVKKLFGNRFPQPLDAGITFFDGRPLLGRSKTLRGVLSSLLATTLGALLIGLSPVIGIIVAVTAMAGDLLSSFVKRRLALAPSSQAIGLDQVPESLLPLLACRTALSLNAIDITLAVAIFFAGELVLSRLLYKAHLRDEPY